MKYLKTYEDIVNDTSSNSIYGKYLKNEIRLLRRIDGGIDGYIDFDYYACDDYNDLNHPNEVQYMFRFEENGDLTKITDYLSKYKIQYKVFSYQYGMSVSFYIKDETIKEYVELLNAANKYNL